MKETEGDSSSGRGTQGNQESFNREQEHYLSSLSRLAQS